MTVEISTIFLLDVATGESVEGELRDAIEQPQLDDWQTKWQPALLAVLQELARRASPSRSGPRAGTGTGSRRRLVYMVCSLFADLASLPSARPRA